MVNKDKEIYEIQFKGERKGIFCNPNNLEIEVDDYVIVEVDKGEDIGYVFQKGSLVIFKCDKMGIDKKTLKSILRPATEEDVAQIEKKSEKEKDAFELCRKKILEHNLPMKLVDVEIQFDQSKMMFYFTAEQRVDFRELVKDLASIYRTRIELRQIGVRDEARRLGGFGICGRRQCCTTFIKEFEQITTNMARDQQLSLNPIKISGNCGRLLCCLKYEVDFYHNMSKVCPMQGYKVKTEKGTATTIHSDIFKEMVTVKYENGEEEQVPCSGCTILEQEIKEETPPAAPAEGAKE